MLYFQDVDKSLFLDLSRCCFSKTLVILFSDIAMATSRARQRNGVVQRCAKAPRNVQNAARAAEKSVTTDNRKTLSFPRIVHTNVSLNVTSCTFKGVSTPSISGDSRADTWKEYVGFNCTIQYYHQH